MSKNPIIEYKQANGLTWDALAKKVGMSHQWLQRLSTMSKKTVGKMTLESILKCNKGGIDLLKWYNSK